MEEDSELATEVSPPVAGGLKRHLFPFKEKITFKGKTLPETNQYSSVC